MRFRLSLLGISVLLCAAMMSSCRRRDEQAGYNERVPAQDAEAAATVKAEEEPAPVMQEEAAVTALPKAAEPAVQEKAEDAAPQAEARTDENPDYGGGNGTVLSYVESDWVRKIVRKCEMDVTVGGMLSDDGHVVYESMEKENPVTTLQDGDKVSLIQQCTLEYLTEPKSEFGSERGDLWYKVLLPDGTDGWICAEDNYLSRTTTPYYGNSYELLEKLSSGGKNWTVRRLEQTLSVWENLNIRDKPGTGGNVLYTIRPGKTDPSQTNVSVTAVTEEEDTVDGITDRWVRVQYKDYEGWLFGGYLSAERGGPKYFIPEQAIAFDLGDLP